LRRGIFLSGKGTKKKYTIHIDQQTHSDLQGFILKKYGTVHGHISSEIEEAIKNHIKGKE
jgi:hypothetical protein